MVKELTKMEDKHEKDKKTSVNNSTAIHSFSNERPKSGLSTTQWVRPDSKISTFRPDSRMTKFSTFRPVSGITSKFSHFNARPMSGVSKNSCNKKQINILSQRNSSSQSNLDCMKMKSLSSVKSSGDLNTLKLNKEKVKIVKEEKEYLPFRVKEMRDAFC